MCARLPASLNPQRKHESASVLVDQLYEAFSEARERQFVKDKQLEMLAAREQALQNQVEGLSHTVAALSAALSVVAPTTGGALLGSPAPASTAAVAVPSSPGPASTQSAQEAAQLQAQLVRGVFPPM